VYAGKVYGAASHVATCSITTAEVPTPASHKAGVAGRGGEDGYAVCLLLFLFMPDAAKEMRRGHAAEKDIEKAEQRVFFSSFAPPENATPRCQEERCFSVFWRYRYAAAERFAAFFSMKVTSVYARQKQETRIQELPCLIAFARRRHRENSTQTAKAMPVCPELEQPYHAPPSAAAAFLCFR